MSLFSVSIKALIVENQRTILLKNERNEWELAGGKLERGESPMDCVVREVSEELGLRVNVKSILDSWLYEVGRKQVLIVTYLCKSQDDLKNAKLSLEHKELKIFSVNDVFKLNMPEGYKDSYRKFLEV